MSATSATPSGLSVQLRAAVWAAAAVAFLVAAAALVAVDRPRPAVAAAVVAGCAAVLAVMDARLAWRRPAPATVRRAAIDTTPPAGCVRVEPVGASLHSTEYAATPELAVWSDRESGRTWLAVRFARVLVEVELEPGQVDTVTAGLLDEVPVPYELADLDAELEPVAASWRGWW